MNTESFVPVVTLVVRRALQFLVGAAGAVTLGGQVDAVSGTIATLLCAAAAEWLSKRAALRQQALGAAKADGVIAMSGIGQAVLNASLRDELNEGVKAPSVAQSGDTSPAEPGEGAVKAG